MRNKKVQIVVGLVLGIALVWFLFRSADWKAVISAIQHCSWWWLAASMLIMLPEFFTRTQRWTYIVRSAGPVAFRAIFSATQIGFLAVLILPARLGEFVRAVVLARLAKLPFSKCMAMVALDRITDFTSLLAVILVTIFTYSPSQDVKIPKELFGWDADFVFAAATVQRFEMRMTIIVIMALAVLVTLYLRPGLVLALSDRCAGLISKRFATWLHTFLQHFLDGLSVFRSPSDMFKAIFFSLVTWCFYMAPLWGCLHAFNIDCPWYTPFVIELLVAVLISMPLLPGYIGQFHLGIVVALRMVNPDIDFSTALAFAIVVHIINLLPVVVLGAFCLFWEKFGIVELGRETKHSVEEAS